jgi:hypothetical protein
LAGVAKAQLAAAAMAAAASSEGRGVRWRMVILL